MKILVTGATGFIGTYLLEQLVSKKISIKAIFHDTEPQLSREIIKQIEWVKADITDIHSLQNTLSDIDVIYHCTGAISNKYTPYERKNIYLNGTKNIINLAIVHHIKKLVYISQSNTLQTINEQGLITEQLPHSSLFIEYDKHDIVFHETEKEIWRGMAEGLPSIIINPTHILGITNNWHTTENLFKQVYQNVWAKAFPIGYNGFVTLHNVVEAMILLMQSNVQNQRFIISAENMSYENILSFIAKGFHKPIAKNALTKNKIENIIFNNSIKHLLNKNYSTINKQNLIIMNANRQYDNSKFLKYFKHFQYQSIAESISTICESYKQKFRLK